MLVLVTMTYCILSLGEISEKQISFSMFRYVSNQKSQQKCICTVNAKSFNHSSQSIIDFKTESLITVKLSVLDLPLILYGHAVQLCYNSSYAPELCAEPSHIDVQSLAILMCRA